MLCSLNMSCILSFPFDAILLLLQQTALTGDDHVNLVHFCSFLFWFCFCFMESMSKHPLGIKDLGISCWLHKH